MPNRLPKPAVFPPPSGFILLNTVHSKPQATPALKVISEHPEETAKCVPALQQDAGFSLNH